MIKFVVSLLLALFLLPLNATNSSLSFSNQQHFKLNSVASSVNMDTYVNEMAALPV